MAFATSRSTSSRLPHDRANRPSVWRALSKSSRRVKVLKNGSVRSITNAFSLTIMQAAFSSVNFGLFSKPSFAKKAIDFVRSRTGRLTKIIRVRLDAMTVSFPWSRTVARAVEPGLGRTGCDEADDVRRTPGAMSDARLETGGR